MSVYLPLNKSKKDYFSGSTCSIINYGEGMITDIVISKAKAAVLKLTSQGVTDFLFGKRSEFNFLCYKEICFSQKSAARPSTTLISGVGSKHLHEADNEAYHTTFYDNVLFFADEINLERAPDHKRDQRMIDLSDYCIFNFDEGSPSTPAETIKAYEYACKNRKMIINLGKGFTM
ncbi:MAG: hypothetical protein J5762_06725 [Clostridia bacterium]|nr:hypothetical protein [Clostridia bacterium]